VQIFVIWGNIMIMVYALWRRTAFMAMGGRSEGIAEVVSLLHFTIQLFDDLFTDILFLSVKPFGPLFFGMLVVYVCVCARHVMCVGMFVNTMSSIASVVR